MDSFEEIVRDILRVHYLCGVKEGMLDSVIYARSLERLSIEAGEDTKRLWDLIETLETVIEKFEKEVDSISRKRVL